MKVAILGASNKPDRYSYQAFQELRAKGHEVFPIHPILKDIDGCPVHSSLTYLTGAVDTITVYISPEKSTKAANEILGSRAKRVIFNPGAENPELASQLARNGFETLEACTLVLLRSGQF